MFSLKRSETYVIAFLLLVVAAHSAVRAYVHARLPDVVVVRATPSPLLSNPTSQSVSDLSPDKMDIGAGDSAEEGGDAPARADDRIELNSASFNDLTSLPGIGPTIAQRILDYREQIGGFRDVSQLLDVPGIGQKRFERLLPFITLGGLDD